MNKIYQSNFMLPINAYQEYRITTVYAQTIFSNQPIISPTSKTSGRWLVYKGYIKIQTYHIPHTEDMYQIYQQREKDTLLPKDNRDIIK